MTFENLRAISVTDYLCAHRGEPVWVNGCGAFAETLFPARIEDGKPGEWSVSGILLLAWKVGQERAGTPAVTWSVERPDKLLVWITA